MLKKYGVLVKGKLFDIMFVYYFINFDMCYNMDVLVEIYFNYMLIFIEEFIGKKGKN